MVVVVVDADVIDGGVGCGVGDDGAATTVAVVLIIVVVGGEWWVLMGSGCCWRWWWFCRVALVVFCVRMHACSLQAVMVMQGQPCVGHPGYHFLKM